MTSVNGQIYFVSKRYIINSRSANKIKCVTMAHMSRKI